MATLIERLSTFLNRPCNRSDISSTTLIFCVVVGVFAFNICLARLVFREALPHNPNLNC